MGVTWIIAGACWGIAEATLFFIVPDVILTYATVRFGWRQGLRLAVITATAAAVAGIGMYVWGRINPASARHMLLVIPAIGPDLIGRTSAEMGGLWPLNLMVGAITGVPYKLYAVAAGAHHVPLFWFAVASYLARFFRFAFSVGVTWLGLDIAARLGLERWRYHVLTAGWIALYTVYFGLRAGA